MAVTCLFPRVEGGGVASGSDVSLPQGGGVASGSDVSLPQGGGWRCC